MLVRLLLVQPIHLRRRGTEVPSSPIRQVQANEDIMGQFEKWALGGELDSNKVAGVTASFVLIRKHCIKLEQLKQVDIRRDLGVQGALLGIVTLLGYMVSAFK